MDGTSEITAHAKAELGFGTAGIGNLYHAITDAEAHQTLKSAAQSGLTFWDTAPYYGLGLAETRIGGVLHEIGHDTIRLSTKVGRRLEPNTTDSLEQFGFAEPLPNRPVFDYSASGIKRSIEQSLLRLGVAHVETVYFHDLGELTHGEGHEDHWRDAIEGGLDVLLKLKRDGTIAKVGIGANETAVLQRALETGAFDCFLLAGRYTLFEHQDALRLLNDCHEQGVSVAIGGPFNSGLLATRPSSASRYNYETAPASVVERAQALWDICDRFDVSASAAAIQFAGAHPAVTQVLAGGQTPQHVQGLVDAKNAVVPDDLWAELRSLGYIANDAPTPRSSLLA